MIWNWNFTGSKIRLSRLAQKNLRDHVVYSTPEGDDNDVIGKRHGPDNSSVLNEKG